MSDIPGKPQVADWNLPMSAKSFLMGLAFCLISPHPVLADSPSFIQKVRVGLHQNTVRVVLVLDQKPARPQITEMISANPTVALRGVMPGTGVHRSLVVKTPSFKKFLTQINVSYNPDSRMTILSVRFVRPVAPPKVMILRNPDRLVLDFLTRPSGPETRSAENPTPRPHQPKRIVIPGKALPSPHTPPGNLQSSHPTPSGKVPSDQIPRPQVLSSDLSSPNRPFRVILDAGHGGKDCGTRSLSGICEKVLVLDIVKRLKRRLRHDLRFQVILTRVDDRFVPLPERTKIANENHGDLFLSVHANADPDDAVRGLETFLLNLHSSDPRAQQIAQRENSALGVSQGDLSAILLTLKINHKKKRSWELAQEISENLYTSLNSDFPVRNLGVRQAPFYVIMGTTMPAVLTEVNFLSNRTDARLMDSARFREKTALALYRGIVAYYRNVHPETLYPHVTPRLVHQEMTAREP